MLGDNYDGGDFTCYGTPGSSPLAVCHQGKLFVFAVDLVEMLLILLVIAALVGGLWYLLRRQRQRGTHGANPQGLAFAPPPRPLLTADGATARLCTVPLSATVQYGPDDHALRAPTSATNVADGRLVPLSAPAPGARTASCRATEQAVVRGSCEPAVARNVPTAHAFTVMSAVARGA